MNLILENIDFMPCPRPRFSRSGHAYHEPKYSKYLEDMVLLVRSEINRVGCDIDKNGIIDLELLFEKCRDRLVIIMHNSTIERSPKRADIDNLAKTFLDILQYAMDFNDKQVYSIAADWR